MSRSPTTLASRDSVAPSPARPGNRDSYPGWRDRKLERYHAFAADLVIEINDPQRLRDSEAKAIVERIAACNLVIYRTRRRPDPAALRAFGHALGLSRVDRNPASGELGVSVIEVGNDHRNRYVPYTDRSLGWHTDGCYNPPDRAVRAFLLHCVRPARAGGDTRLVDHEMVYIRLRERDPRLVDALMDPRAITIPANDDEGELLRGPCSGPVFLIHPDRRLGMRYTARRRHIEWLADDLVRAAARAITDILDGADDLVIQRRLEDGEGVLCNNVLHTRSAFDDDPAARRRLLRVRWLDPVRTPDDAENCHAVGE